jgi:chaperonin GroES
MNIKPLADRVVIEVVEEKEKKVGGIIMPDSAKEKPQQGKVVAVGKGKRSDSGELIDMEVNVGDTVLFSKYSGTEIKIDQKEYLVMRESDLLAIIG